MHVSFTPWWLPPAAFLRLAARSTPFLLTLTLAACGGGDAAPAGGPPGGGMPPMPVQAVTLAERPLDQATEYVGVVKSRRSTTIQPQVEGFITRIPVQSGDRVRAGAVIVEIDSNRQAAAVASLESQRGARQADVQFARQQAERAKTLQEAGAISLQELEQAQTALQTSEAQLAAIEAQIREQRVDLAYHRVTAPVAGIVGDIPNRVGDRVTTGTVITTIDQNAGLEVYIYVPVSEAPRLAPGLAVRLLGTNDEVAAETKVSFVSPAVTDQTQSVLVKAPLPAGTPFRTEQFVRAQVVWSTSPGLTVPVTAVTRINGQYFVFVAEKGENGALTAHQRPVSVGGMLGNDYVVLDGLEAGQQLIVSGIQKIGDGAPVQIVPAAAAAAPAGSQAADAEAK